MASESLRDQAWHACLKFLSLCMHCSACSSAVLSCNVDTLGPHLQGPLPLPSSSMKRKPLYEGSDEHGIGLCTAVLSYCHAVYMYLQNNPSNVGRSAIHFFVGRIGNLKIVPAKGAD